VDGKYPIDLVGNANSVFSCSQVKWTYEWEVGACHKSCDACFHKRQKCEGAIWPNANGGLTWAAVIVLN
jgi:hypothetical protein